MPVSCEQETDRHLGGNSEYLGVTSNYDGGVEVAISEWPSQQSSVTLSKEQTQALMEGLQKVLK